MLHRLHLRATWGCLLCLTLAGCANTLYYGDPNRVYRDLEGWKAKAWLQCCRSDTTSAGRRPFWLTVVASVDNDRVAPQVGIDSIMIIASDTSSQTESVIWSRRVEGRPPHPEITEFDEGVEIAEPLCKGVVVRVFYSVSDDQGQTRRTHPVDYVLPFKKQFTYGGP